MHASMLQLAAISAKDIMTPPPQPTIDNFSADIQPRCFTDVSSPKAGK